MNRTEQYRRHHRCRILEKVSRWEYWDHSYKKWPELKRRYQRVRARTRQVCSCLACGNQRQYEGPTMQERRADLDMADQIEEWLEKYE